MVCQSALSICAFTLMRKRDEAVPPLIGFLNGLLLFVVHMDRVQNRSCNGSAPARYPLPMGQCARLRYRTGCSQRYRVVEESASVAVLSSSLRGEAGFG